MATGVRDKITLACTECKRRNYQSQKNKRNTPDRVEKQVIQGTVVVIIACAIVGTYLWGADLVLQRFVENVLLGQ
jgi:hypothetical protein